MDASARYIGERKKQTTADYFLNCLYMFVYTLKKLGEEYPGTVNFFFLLGNLTRVQGRMENKPFIISSFLSFKFFDHMCIECLIF